MLMYTKALTFALAYSDLLDVEASFELRGRLRPSHIAPRMSPRKLQSCYNTCLMALASGQSTGLLVRQ